MTREIRKNYLNDNTGRNPGGMVAGLTADTTYGEGVDIKAQVAATGGLPDASIAKTRIPTRGQTDIEAFGPTQFQEEVVTSGMSMGPGPGPTTATKFNFNDFAYQSWIESGDDSLLAYII
tara:strand:+ start:98 stop:457 length:360 start_codon:yes stop_codon:yes gene_type:complete